MDNLKLESLPPLGNKIGYHVTHGRSPAMKRRQLFTGVAAGMLAMLGFSLVVTTLVVVRRLQLQKEQQQQQQQHWGPVVDEDYFAPRPDVPEDLYALPDGFLLGAASSAYQVEGGWNESEKTASILDAFFHARPHLDHGDVACDSYHRWREDVALLKDLGMRTYRFSLSWPRLLPRGDQAGGADPVAVRYYDALIDELLANDIVPIVTVHHWDVPQRYQEDSGGWLSPLIVDRFVDLADFAFKTFGDKVKMWILINEPRHFCLYGEERGEEAPGVAALGTGGYLCAHHMLLAHTKAYHLYNDTYRATQRGSVGSTFDIQYQQPWSSAEADVEAAHRATIFSLAWVADPLHTGDYPPLMRQIVDANSEAAGLAASRLPRFTEEQQRANKGAWDFIGINQYTAELAKAGSADASTSTVSYANDTNIDTLTDDAWKHSERYDFAVCPWGLRNVLKWIKDRYDNIPVLITESGYGGPQDEGLDDPARLGYYSTYLRAVARAVNEDKCNVIGYTAWCLTDNLEWSSGYSIRFGLAHVDFSSPNRTRTLKRSAALIREVARTGRVPYHEPV